jgi:hypothetical protein
MLTDAQINQNEEKISPTVIRVDDSDSKTHIEEGSRTKT